MITSVMDILIEEIKKIEDEELIFIRVEKSYSGRPIIEMRGVIYKLKQVQMLYPHPHKTYEKDYLYEGEMIFGTEKEEYSILRKTLDFYKTI